MSANVGGRILASLLVVLGVGCGGGSTTAAPAGPDSAARFLSDAATFYVEMVELKRSGTFTKARYEQGRQALKPRYDALATNEQRVVRAVEDDVANLHGTNLSFTREQTAAAERYKEAVRAFERVE